MVNAIAPKAPIGATRLIIATMRKNTSLAWLMTLTSGRAFSPTITRPRPNSTEINSTGRISPLAKASKKVPGMTFSRNPVTPSLCCAWPTKPAMAELSRVFTSILKPTPGCSRCAARMPISSAMVETISKYSSALPPTRPTCFTSCMLVMPETTVQKMIGPMIILISLINPSPSGLRSIPICGHTWPINTPSAIAMSTCT